MKSAIAGLTVSLISVPILGLITTPKAIAQPAPIFIEIPKSNFFPDFVTPARPSTPLKPFSDSATDLKSGENTNDKLKYGDQVPEGVKFQSVQEPNPNELKNPSAFERPLFRLFGFETANTLKRSELIFQISGTSYNTPLDFRLFEDPGSTENRSNDTSIGLTYGISDNVQIGFQIAGKDDTAFANLVRQNSSLQFFYGVVAGQVKWKYYDNESLKAALVVGAEFSSPIPTLFNRGTRTINFSTPGPRQVSDNGSGDQFTATDSSVYISLGFPVAYQATEQLSFHLNPQISFFPSSIPANTFAGSTSTLINSNVGFNGSSLNYYGTVVGLGLGVNYAITPKLQIAADVTPILSGLNSAGVANNSLFVQRAVWNAGLQFAPNNRTALSVFATNRFGPSASAASNLLVQPNGDFGYGFQFSYLPDLAGLYKIETRDAYSDPSTFFSYLNGLPSTTLPIYSTLYQFAFGTNGRLNPTVRFGLLDDLELAVSFTSNDNATIPLELSVLARLALIQDNGKDFTYSSALGIGFTNLYQSNSNIVSLFFDLPTSYRLNSSFRFTVTPKFIFPAQFAGTSAILGVGLGGIYNITNSTQVLAEYTPILSGSNGLSSTFIPSLTSPLSGRIGLFNVGLRQLFNAGNSVYAVDLYFTNSSADYGLQGISALPNGGTQVGLRFNILNGVPESRQSN